MLGATITIDGCSSPTESDALVSIAIEGPATFIVGERVLFTAVGTDARGRSVELTGPLSWATDNSLAVTVSSEGVARGLGRGIATVSVRRAGLEGTLDVTVRARVAIVPVGRLRWEQGTGSEPRWDLAIGDSLRLRATWVDVDGRPLPEVPDAAWSSNRPEIASVTAKGVVMALAQGGTEVVATTPDGSGTLYVGVPDVVAGRPATVRFTHAIAGLGSLRFVPSKGDPVVLSFGESLERAVSSGTFFVDVEGLPPSAEWGPLREYAALIEEGDHLSLYAAGSGDVTFLSAAWTRATVVADDSVRVRLVQGDATYPVVYLLGPDEELGGGLPIDCYFDPLGVTVYHTRPAGDLDIVLQAKFGSLTERRIRVTLPAARSVTLVVTGSGEPVLLLVEDP